MKCHCNIVETKSMCTHLDWMISEYLNMFRSSEQKKNLVHWEEKLNRNSILHVILGIIIVHYATNAFVSLRRNATKKINVKEERRKIKHKFCKLNRTESYFCWQINAKQDYIINTLNTCSKCSYYFYIKKIYSISVICL